MARIITAVTTAAATMAAAIMMRIIPAAKAAEAAAAADADPSLPLPDAMWEKPAALITEAHLMTELSLIPPMTGENLWNLSAVQAR